MENEDKNKGRRFLIMTDVGTYLKVYDKLKKELNKEPSAKELSDAMIEEAAKKENTEIIGSVEGSVSGEKITRQLRGQGMNILDVNEEAKKEYIKKQLKNPFKK